MVWTLLGLIQEIEEIQQEGIRGQRHDGGKPEQIIVKAKSFQDTERIRGAKGHRKSPGPQSPKSALLHLVVWNSLVTFRKAL